MRVCCRYPNENVDGLEISRIDPAAVAAAYRTDVLATAGAGLQASALAVLEEDLRSPCTEERSPCSARSPTPSPRALIAS